MNSESKLEIRLKYETYCYSNAIKSKIQKLYHNANKFKL